MRFPRWQLLLLTLASIAFGANKSEPAPASPSSDLEQATFAGGCFWCMEPPFTGLDGVISVTVGYTGGKKPNPTYKEVSTGTTGHAEAVNVAFDPKKLKYEKLLDIFWKSMDPTDPNGQFADRGSQYRSAIFYHSKEQKRLAEESKARLQKSGKFSKAIVTEIAEAMPFYPAEGYHQHYYKKSPISYHLYKSGSGREDFLKRVWKQ